MSSRYLLRTLFLCHTLRLLLPIGASSLIFINCGTSQAPESACTCDCLPPKKSSFGVHIPALTHRGAKRSPDGKTLAFVINDGAEIFGLLDLTTYETTYISLKDIHPNYPAGGSTCGDLFWSPYSSDRIYLHCVEFYDSSGQTLAVQNGYIYDFRKSKATRITPSMYGHYGSKNIFNFYGWLKGSTEQTDSFLLDNKIYVPQEDKFYPLPLSYSEVISQSLNTNDFFIYKRDSIQNNPPLLIINSERYFFGNHMIGYVMPRWSPSGSTLAFSVKNDFPPTNPNDPSTYEEVWIVDVKTLSSYRLNFQQLFCTYSFMGIYAEFLTDSTLAVSMHKDGADFSPLWEITTKGKLVKQLTFQ